MSPTRLSLTSTRRRFLTHDAPFLRALERRFLRFHKSQVPAGNLKEHEDGQHLTGQARAELRWLVDHVRATPAADGRREDLDRPASLSREQRRQLLSLALRMTKCHEPLSYVLGTQPFGKLELAVKPPTLIPRPETEEWASRLSSLLIQALKQPRGVAAPEEPPPVRILDLCCGSGCIGLLLAHELEKAGWRHWRVTLADLKDTALELATLNVSKVVQQLGVDSSHAAQLQQSIQILKADIFNDRDVDALRQKGQGYDVLVCNPPYIPQRDWDTLDRSVKDWEDVDALVGRRRPCVADKMDEEGLAFYERLGELLPRLLAVQSHTPSPFPMAVFEVGINQASKVVAMMRKAKKNSDLDRIDLEVWKDGWGVERAVAMLHRAR